MTKLIFFFFLIPTYSLCNTAVDGIKITNDSFIKVVKNLNEVLEEKDTNILTDSNCIEIIRISNTIDLYTSQYWHEDSLSKKIISTFLKYVNFKTSFGKDIHNYIVNHGSAEVSSGMGIYYAKFDVYSGGRILNNKSIYRIEK